MPLEVSLTRDLRQPGLMTTLGYAYADAAATPNFSRAVGGGSAGSGSKYGWGGMSAARNGGGTRTCWMLFDYCSKGVLAVSVWSVECGWMHSSRIGMQFYVCLNPSKQSSCAGGAKSPLAPVLCFCAWRGGV